MVATRTNGLVRSIKRHKKRTVVVVVVVVVIVTVCTLHLIWEAKHGHGLGGREGEGTVVAICGLFESITPASKPGRVTKACMPT